MTSTSSSLKHAATFVLRCGLPLLITLLCGKPREVLEPINDREIAHICIFSSHKRLKAREGTEIRTRSDQKVFMAYKRMRTDRCQVPGAHNHLPSQLFQNGVQQSFDGIA